MLTGIKKEIEHIKKAVKELAHDNSGRRFMNYHERQREKQFGHPVKKWLIYVSGFLLIFAGFLLGFVPGAPGFFLGVPGMVIVATHSKFMARLMDRVEVGLRRLLRIKQ